MWYKYSYHRMYFKLARYISLNIMKFLLTNINEQVTVIHTNMHYEVTHTQDLNYVTIYTSLMMLTGNTEQAF